MSEIVKTLFTKECPLEKRAWRIFIDGKEVNVGQIIMVQPQFGLQVELGLRPEGYQGPIIWQPRGGGEVTLPWFKNPADQEIWVGLLMESRPNMGGPNLCVVGGMNSFSLSREETREKEEAEEAGMKSEARGLPGALVNSDRLFMLADPKKGEGIRICAVEVPFEMLEFPDGITTEAIFLSGTEFGKKPGAVIFKPWKTMIEETADGVALAAIARLTAVLF